MKKHLFTIITFMIINNSFSQENNFEKQFKLEYNLLGAGISYEVPLSEKFTLDLGTGVGGGINLGDSYVWEFNSALAAYFKGELKYYYNLTKRAKKGKNTLNNSGNYVALQAKYFTKRFSASKTLEPLYNGLLTEVHWGLQRSLGNNWLFNFHIGVGVLRNLDENYGLLSPSLGFKFSYIIF